MEVCFIHDKKIYIKNKEMNDNKVKIDSKIIDVKRF